MRHLVLAVAILFSGVTGVMGVTNLSNAALQSSHQKGDLDEWALFNTSSDNWSKETAAVKSDNSEWTLFNTSTSFWKAEGDILPEEKHGLDFLKTANADSANKAFN